MPAFFSNHPSALSILNKISLSNHLPRFLTSFVSLEQEMGQLTELLVSQECRLITLLGPGGIGKTRLSVYVADRIIHQHPRQPGH